METAVKIKSRKPTEEEPPKIKRGEMSTAPDRLFTPSCDLMIISDYKKGVTVWEMAELYNRDPGHIIDRIIYLAESGHILPVMWGSKAKGPFPSSPLKRLKKNK